MIIQAEPRDLQHQQCLHTKRFGTSNLVDSKSFFNFNLTDSKVIISISTSPPDLHHWMRHNSYSTWKLLFLLLFHTCMTIFKVLMSNKSTHPHGLKGAGFLRTAGLWTRGFNSSWCHQLCSGRSTKLPAASENVEEFSI